MPKTLSRAEAQRRREKINRITPRATIKKQVLINVILIIIDFKLSATAPLRENKIGISDQLLPENRASFFNS
jgi:hypothetical protein